MDLKLIEAREHLVKAREALRGGDKVTARSLGEKAALLVPHLEDGWLILVAADPNPDEAVAYARKALELNPQSPRAHKALEWAKQQQEKARSEARFGLTVDALSMGQLVGAGNINRVAAPVRDEKRVASLPRAERTERVVGKKSSKRVEEKTNWQLLIYAGAAFLGLLICGVIGLLAWSAFQNPRLASFLPSQTILSTQEPLWAQVADIPKPTVTPLDVSAFAPQPTSVVATPSAVEEGSTLAPEEVVPTETPVPADEATLVPEATEPPGVMAMEIVANTPTSEAVRPPNPPVVASGSGKGGRWIDVNLSTQSVYAYEGDTVVNSFVVSTGTWLTPTVTGQYKIWIKLRSANMSGPGYFLPNVPYIMYFYKGYGLHGTYWHNNFGTPMSHGCVNLRTSDAEWLFNWASVGTVVNVHY